MRTRFDAIANSTLPIPFATYGSNGASISLSGFAASDIRVYKGTSMVERASTAGYTLLDTDGTDIDGVTGIHGFSIDLSNNADPGFYSIGSDYFVVVSAVTVEGQSVSFIAGWFRIVADIADQVLDEVVTGTTTMRQLMRGYAAALLGKADGLSGTTVHYRNLTDSHNVITASVDADGNRSVVTLDLDDTA